MGVVRTETVVLTAPEHVVPARQKVREYALELGFNLVDQTKIVTAASELARNTVVHGGGGIMVLEAIREEMRKGLRLTFEDKGPGIPDINLALTDSFTTGSGLGLGLGGAKRLSDEFHIWSKAGEGTKVVIARWR
jgi:serine/threonine-protein kinase RsbT